LALRDTHELAAALLIQEKRDTASERR
jgi:hypothetical protein